MNKPSYPTTGQSGQQMYQASDGKWYPVQHMPQGWQQGQGQQQQQQYGQQPQYGQQQYGQQQPMYPQQTQPVYVQQQQRPSAGMGAGGGLLAGLCGALLCFDLGACLC